MNPEPEKVKCPTCGAEDVVGPGQGWRHACAPATVQQPPPLEAVGDVWSLVIEDVRERQKFGVAKYGKPVQAFNGRKPLVDAYQEVLDLAVYLRQAIEEGRERERIRLDLASTQYEVRGLRAANAHLQRQRQDLEGRLNDICRIVSAKLVGSAAAEAEADALAERTQREFDRGD